MQQPNLDDPSQQFEVETDNEGEPAARPIPGVFYQIDGGNVSFKELRLTSSLATSMLAWCILKIFRSRIPSSTDDVPVESLEPFLTPEHSLPPELRTHFAQASKELANLGFHSPTYYCIPDHLHSTDHFLVTFAHSSRPIVARAHVRFWHLKSKSASKPFTEFITAFADNTFLWSLSGKPDLHAPASCHIVRQPTATIPELFRMHEQAIIGLPTKVTPIPARTPQEATGTTHRLHEQVRDFHLRRGVFRPLTDTDKSHRQTLISGFTAAAQAQSKHPAVMAELHTLQNKRPGWAVPIFLLIISLILFLALGFRGQSLLRVLALVPILFIHELGHFVTMKAFGYRNLRMFFIPGFGAAVTGRHYNVPGWKKAVVYLMGPVPSILLGIILGLFGIVSHTEILIQAALLTLALNGLNLLPLIPFDGGHVVHLVLFSRHKFLDIGFRALTAGGIVILGALIQSYVFIGLGSALLAGLPQALRIRNIAQQLRDEGVPTISPDDQTIPLDVAERITDKLLAENKKPLHAKLVAQQVLQVFETLNTKPPGVLASIGLAGTHLLSLAAALFVALMLIVAQRGTLQQYMQAGARRPAHPLASPIPAPASAPAQSSKSDITGATFKNAAAADAAYNALLPRLAPGQSVARFGDSVFIRFPADDSDARKHAITLIEEHTTDYFVTSKSLTASFSFQAFAPSVDEAKAIDADLKQYFGLPLDPPTAAPWSTQTHLTPQQHLARKTYSAIQRATYGMWSRPEIEALDNRVEEARKKGDMTLAKSLQTQRTQLTESTERALIAELAADPNLDSQLVHTYLEVIATGDRSDRYARINAAMVPLLGQPAPSDLTYATSGYHSRTGLIIELPFISFADPASGALALSNWLTSRGCTRLRYDLDGEPNEYEDEDVPPVK